MVPRDRGYCRARLAAHMRPEVRLHGPSTRQVTVVVLTVMILVPLIDLFGTKERSLACLLACFTSLRSCLLTCLRFICCFFCSVDPGDPFRVCLLFSGSLPCCPLRCAALPTAAAQARRPRIAERAVPHSAGPGQAHDVASGRRAALGWAGADMRCRARIGWRCSRRWCRC